VVGWSVKAARSPALLVARHAREPTKSLACAKAVLKPSHSGFTPELGRFTWRRLFFQPLRAGTSRGPPSLDRDRPPVAALQTLARLTSGLKPREASVGLENGR